MNRKKKTPMPEEWPIYPLVKQLVARTATAALWLLVAVVVLSLAELVLSFCGGWLVAVAALAGLAEQLAGAVVLLLLAPVAGWCHLCLLAGRGQLVTRYGVLLVIFFAGVDVLGNLWLLLFGEPLLVNQGVLPIVLSTALCVGILLNLPAAAAAPPALRWRLGLLGLFLLISRVLDIPGPMLLLALPFKALCCWTAWLPLHLLAETAPRVVGLPPVEPPAQRS